MLCKARRSRPAHRPRGDAAESDQSGAEHDEADKADPDRARNIHQQFGAVG